MTDSTEDTPREAALFSGMFRSLIGRPAPREAYRANSSRKLTSIKDIVARAGREPTKSE